MVNECLPKLLEAIASSENAKAAKHDVILRAAAAELTVWRTQYPEWAETIANIAVKVQESEASRRDFLRRLRK